jgi:hypothetical protein
MATDQISDDVLFEEVQTFRQTSACAMMVGVFIVVVGSFLAGVIAAPEKVAGGVWIMPAVLFLCIWGGVGVFLFMLTLTVRVDQHHLHVHFFPLVRKSIPLEDIDQWEARTYRPILEYGGWGVRYSWNGTAYNVSGNRGVQLVLASGKRLLIGSQRAEELAMAITEAKRLGNA